MLEISCGFLISVSIYLLLENNLLRRIVAIMLLSTVINITVLLSGGFDSVVPAFVQNNLASDHANPLPQALVLTALVIGFGFLAVMCMLVKNIIKNEAKIDD